MEERTSASIITDLKNDGVEVQTLKTRDDVDMVLDFIGAPGDHRDLKDEVISILFTKKTSQGYRTVDDLETYANY